MRRPQRRQKLSSAVMTGVMMGTFLCFILSVLSTAIAALAFSGPSAVQAAMLDEALLLSNFEDPSFGNATGGGFESKRGELTLHDLLMLDFYRHGNLPLPDEVKEEMSESEDIERGSGASSEVIQFPTFTAPPASVQDGYFLRLDAAQTISQLAQKFGVDDQELARMNHVGRDARLRAGGLVFLPSPAGSSRRNDVAFLIPASGRFTSGFGYRRLYGRVRHHDGIDIANDRGTPIMAAATGRVVLAEWSGGYGRCIKIEHASGVETIYGHCSRLLVSEGDRVQAGQVIALIGSTGRSTGPHLHFEIRIDNTPVDPLRFIDVRETTVAGR